MDMATSDRDQNQSICSICGKHCKGSRGVTMHIIRAHPQHHRNRITSPNLHQQQPETTQNNESINYETQTQNETDELNQKLTEFTRTFQAILAEYNEDQFINEYKAFTEFMKQAVNQLPGPKHPAIKFYKSRKKKNEFRNNDRNFQETNNPIRKSKRDRVRRNARYQYDLMQFNYYNYRKKCVHSLLNRSENKSCMIPSEQLHKAFTTRWSTCNNNIRLNYGTPPSQTEQRIIDEDFNLVLTEEEVAKAIKGINRDTSSGVDRISIRAVKFLRCTPAIARIASIMLTHNVIPPEMLEARSVLIYKSGDPALPGNWRPISICSIIRRVVERILDTKLRSFIKLSVHQRGFTNQPGTHINTSLVSQCLKKAKKKKLNLSVVFLDVTKAFDQVGFKHLEKTLESSKLPTALRNLILSLITSNYTRVETNGRKTDKIHFFRGLLQGAPLSPTLYNLAADFILRELNEPEVSAKFGFNLVNHLPNLAAIGFADDTALLADSRQSAVELTHMTRRLFSEIGLQVNYSKCNTITIDNGLLKGENLLIDELTSIADIQKGERIKYLGVNFEDELIFDRKMMVEVVNSDLEHFVNSPLLKQEQKLCILNQYIWPKTTYGFQTAPINKIPFSFLEDLDKLIRSSVKEIVGLPTDTATSMLYAPQKYKGLGLIRLAWEAFIQIHSICVQLKKCENEYIMSTRKLDDEMKSCRTKLQLGEPPEIMMMDSRKIARHFREELRQKEFDSWTKLRQKGKGAVLFDQCHYVNKLIMNKVGLSSSEWTSTIKMVGNVAAVRNVPGRSPDTTRCRYCDEKESLGHVLGFCQHGHLLRNNRHHSVRSLIADYLRKKNHEVIEEVPCLAVGGSRRQVDILAFNNNTREGYILDPTIRMEDCLSQAEDVDKEKKAIYEPCIPDLLHKFNLRGLEVIGLFVGARGTITSFFECFRDKFGLPKKLTEEIAISVVKSSVTILHHHIVAVNVPS